MPLSSLNIPFALSIGPQRAGTTWIYRYLASRGDICLPEEVKEIFFFDRNYDRGHSFYKDHFKPKKQHQIAMEVTATSFDHPQAPKRVFETCHEHVRFICPIRHPVIRTYSLYLHYLRYGLASGTLQEACEQVPQILESSRYAKHLERWYEYFKPEQIKFIYQEQLEKDQFLFVKNLCEGLGIPFLEPEEEVQGRYNITTYSKFSPVARAAQHAADWMRDRQLYSVINVAKRLGIKRIIFGKERPDASKTNIPDAERHWLLEQLEGEVDAFQKLTGEDLKHWSVIEDGYKALDNAA
ncbi:MAG: sulfotransferase [Pseudomonadota bacterium]